MNLKLKFLFVFGLLSFMFPSDIFAMSLSISNLPTSIDRQEEASVDLLFSCSGCGDSYIRGVFYPSGTDYFGFTKDNFGNWIGTESDRSLYFKVARTDLVEASWSGRINVKPDTNSLAYSGPGEYLFKLGRYTSAADASADWSNELPITITGPTPSPSPIPTVQPTNQPTQSPTHSPSPTPTKTPSPRPFSSKSPSPVPVATGQVLGQSSKTSEPSPTVLATQEEAKNPPLFALVLIGFGIILIGISGYFAFRKQKETVSENNI